MIEKILNLARWFINAFAAVLFGTALIAAVIFGLDEQHGIADFFRTTAAGLLFILPVILFNIAYYQVKKRQRMNPRTFNRTKLAINLLFVAYGLLIIILFIS